jgi:hypothetical protein
MTIDAKVTKASDKIVESWGVKLDKNPSNNLHIDLTT